MRKTTVTVKPALRADRGRRHLRIPSAVRAQLGAGVGETVSVAANSRAIKLKVAKADKRLVGEAICRIDPASRKYLQIEPGEEVEIRRSTKTQLMGEIDSEEYDIIIVERTVDNPFQISSQLMAITRSQVKYKRSVEGKARALFRWVCRNVEYGDSGRGSVGYRDSLEVKASGEGVCGEMAFLYVTMCRIAGLCASFVVVRRDHRGKRVSHACAAVETGAGPVLVDPAYQMFDVKHRDYQIMNDTEAHRAFLAMRNYPPGN